MGCSRASHRARFGSPQWVPFWRPALNSSEPEPIVILTPACVPRFLFHITKISTPSGKGLHRLAQPITGGCRHIQSLFIFILSFILILFHAAVPSIFSQIGLLITSSLALEDHYLLGYYAWIRLYTFKK
ncbi:hypothetical protein B0J11DRAFT_531282 [Dendryphion nanum]|uniref:Uncharacterized protein n=1 Tax=Dendryphion nanum TaxID=256645 RepID=A0A9P9IKA4_9PLEO|nr:hypothetical protein B0J11DRAFT_531282 [Dendryphion nanum]